MIGVSILYLSAYLDSEQRLVAAKVIKRFILHAKKTGFVVEHDFIMATYLADRYEGMITDYIVYLTPDYRKFPIHYI